MSETKRLLPYSSVIIKLLKGVIYNEERESWSLLIGNQSEIRKYLDVMGLDLLIYESEGFAFLRQRNYAEIEQGKIPSLIEKRQMGYYVSLLCVLLVEKLYEFDIRGGEESSRLILDKEEIKEMLQLYLPDVSNEAKQVEKIDIHINKLIDFGFLRTVDEKGDKLEVRRILKAKIPAATLVEMKQKLAEYGSA